MRVVPLIEKTGLVTAPVSDGHRKAGSGVCIAANGLLPPVAEMTCATVPFAMAGVVCGLQGFKMLYKGALSICGSRYVDQAHCPVLALFATCCATHPGGSLVYVFS